MNQGVFSFFSLLALGSIAFANNQIPTGSMPSSHPGAGSKIVFTQDVHVRAGVDKVSLERKKQDNVREVMCDVSVVPSSSDRVIAKGKELSVVDQVFSHDSSGGSAMTWNLKGSPSIKSITCDVIGDPRNIGPVTISRIVRNFEDVFKLSVAAPRAIVVDRKFAAGSRGAVVFKSDIYISPVNPTYENRDFPSGETIGQLNSAKGYFYCRIAATQASNYFRYIPKGTKLYYDSANFESTGKYYISLKLYGSPEIDAIDCFGGKNPSEINSNDAIRTIENLGLVELL